MAVQYRAWADWINLVESQIKSDARWIPGNSPVDGVVLENACSGQRTRGTSTELTEVRGVKAIKIIHRALPVGSEVSLEGQITHSKCASNEPGLEHLNRWPYATFLWRVVCHRETPRILIDAHISPRIGSRAQGCGGWGPFRMAPSSRVTVLPHWVYILRLEVLDDLQRNSIPLAHAGLSLKLACHRKSDSIQVAPIPKLECLLVEFDEKVQNSGPRVGPLFDKT
ncbi:hypothetical protein BJ322DRAFT_1024399 [Thelephora terrestris]|uniref:Uncharacterized protein n=1 Tax=Thelephora terrestris TaxID=56493 RepID=A0A9P6H5L5_9AGAM|nr:hypothetical protein BJ322DRAFT_1024399 [Thelephora terrestris]